MNPEPAPSAAPAPLENEPDVAADLDAWKQWHQKPAAPAPELRAHAPSCARRAETYDGQPILMAQYACTCGAAAPELRCESTQRVAITERPFQADEHATARCQLPAGHLGSHEGPALDGVWWWNAHGHGLTRGSRHVASAESECPAAPELRALVTEALGYVEWLDDGGNTDVARVIHQLCAALAGQQEQIRKLEAKWEPAKHSLGSAWKERADTAEAEAAALREDKMEAERQIGEQYRVIEALREELARLKAEKAAFTASDWRAPAAPEPSDV